MSKRDFTSHLDDKEAAFSEVASNPSKQVTLSCNRLRRRGCESVVRFGVKGYPTSLDDETGFLCLAHIIDEDSLILYPLETRFFSVVSQKNAQLTF